jgi:hypothetical protein
MFYERFYIAAQLQRALNDHNYAKRTSKSLPFFVCKEKYTIMVRLLGNLFEKATEIYSTKELVRIILTRYNIKRKC